VIGFTADRVLLAIGVAWTLVLVSLALGAFYARVRDGKKPRDRETGGRTAVAVSSPGGPPEAGAPVVPPETSAPGRATTRTPTPGLAHRPGTRGLGTLRDARKS
jgi:hypothetical protein